MSLWREMCIQPQKKVFSSQDGNYDKVFEDVKALKADVINLKNTIKLLMQNCVMLRKRRSLRRTGKTSLVPIEKNSLATAKKY